MNKTTFEIIAGAMGACVGFVCVALVIDQLYVLCFVKKAAYATLIGMPLGSFAGILLVDRFLYGVNNFSVVGMLMGLAFTMIFLLAGIRLVALAPVIFFAFPVLISLCCVLGHKIGFTIQIRKRAATQHGID
jgi:hypothetical protein